MLVQTIERACYLREAVASFLVLLALDKLYGVSAEDLLKRVAREEE